MSGLIKLTSRWQQVTHAKAIMGSPMMMMMMMVLYAYVYVIIISSMIITMAIYNIYAPKSIIILWHSGGGIRSLPISTLL